MIADLINGSFEFIAGFMQLLNVWQLYKDKQVKGVHWVPTVFFTSWGFWNLYYYPFLDQWLSFFGGLSIVGVNSLWLYMVYRYRKN